MSGSEEHHCMVPEQIICNVCGISYGVVIAAKDRAIKDLEAWIDDVVRGRCAIKDCPNKPSEGIFVGTLCAPCSEMNYRTEIKRLKAEIERKDDALLIVSDEVVLRMKEPRTSNAMEVMMASLVEAVVRSALSPAPQPAKEDK